MNKLLRTSRLQMRSNDAAAASVQQVAGEGGRRGVGAGRGVCMWGVAHDNSSKAAGHKDHVQQSHQRHRRE